MSYSNKRKGKKDVVAVILSSYYPSSYDLRRMDQPVLTSGCRLLKKAQAKNTILLFNATPYADRPNK